MGDDDHQNPPIKKSKVMDSKEELQLALEAKNKALFDLAHKFDVICKENEKLRKIVDDLTNKLEADISSEYEEEYEDDEEMNVEENNPAEFTGSGLKRKLANDGESLVNNNGNSNEVSKDNEAGKNKIKVGKAKHVPIVTTYNINIKDISRKLEAILGHKDYNIKILGKNVTNIGVCTLDDFEKLKCLLKDEKIHFYTYTPRGQRPLSVVVKGLSDAYDEKEVREYMDGLQISVRIVGLTKLGRDRWLFRMGRESDVKGFQSIKYILHCRVYMEKYKRRQLIQCYNCQRFGHVALNCNMPYRCVKCGGGHGPGKCQVPPKDKNNTEILMTDPMTGQAVKKIGFPTKCVNCGVVGHVASARECPKRQELLRKVQTRKVNNSSKVSDHRYRSGVSYAAVARATGASTTQANIAQNYTTKADMSLASAVEEFKLIDGDCRRLLGGGLLTCLGKFKGFANEYRKLKNDEEKSQALLGMLMSLQYNG